MSRADVVAAVRAAGIPVVHMAWPKGSAPRLPWAAYYLDDQDGMYADDEVWAAVERWVVELYEREPDEDLEALLESSISEAFGPFDKSETWVESEGCTQTTYRFTQTEIGE